MQDNSNFLIAVNSGYYNTKVKTSEVEDVFYTKVRECIDPSCNRTLEIDGTLYEIGDGTKNISDAKHDNLTHRLCTIYSIAKYVPDSSNVHLVTCLPINNYLDNLYRELYKMSFTNVPDYCVIVDGVVKKFTIKEVTVYMEGACAILPYASYFKDKVIGVIDVGGYTINCAIFNRQKLVSGTSFSLDKGMYHLERNISDKLCQIGYGYVKEYEMEYMFETSDPLISDIVNTECLLLLTELREKLVEKGWNLKLLDLFGTGGGSIRLNKHLLSMFGNIVIHDTGLYDNVRGLYKVGEISEKVHKHM